MGRTSRLTRENTGFLLAKAMQRWNELLREGFCRNGFGFVRPSYGSILIPLFEEDGLRIGELARRSKLSKQTMTTMVRLLERDGLIKRVPDERDARASRIYLSTKAKRFRPVAETVVADIERIVRQTTSEEQFAAVRAWLRTLANH
jgi:DNA-binding MarR family transcriptional regulator